MTARRSMMRRQQPSGLRRKGLRSRSAVALQRDTRICHRILHCATYANLQKSKLSQQKNPNSIFRAPVLPKKGLWLYTMHTIPFVNERGF